MQRMSRRRALVFIAGALVFIAGVGIAVFLIPATAQPAPYERPPESKDFNLAKLKSEPMCPPDIDPDWREKQTIEGVTIAADPSCSPDNPADIAVFVKGANNVSHDTIMETQLALDTVTKNKDRDGDGDPDEIHVTLEVAELNGFSPDFPTPIPGYFIAPGIQPGMWVFKPKTVDMSTINFESTLANPYLRAPSPTIRVEQGDTIKITLENTHYFPHTIHLHGVDHPFVDSNGEGNDGVPHTSEVPVMPGKSRTYEMTPRHAGTMMYHCHVQPHVHIMMGLAGLFVIEENRPNNWVQTLNVGAGKVRSSSAAVREAYDQEYDLLYQSLDKELSEKIRIANDVRLIAHAMNQEYDITDATADYFLLNGRSYPYTMRESLIIVEPNQRVKIRMGNAEILDGIAVHSHGHKMTITAYDGVKQNPEAWITRDVYWLASFQRLDLALNTTIDGLHSYGEGIWTMHDHAEKSITTNGVHPGGAMNEIVYKSFLAENGMPRHQGVDLRPYFSEAFYQRKVPVWTSFDQDNLFGDVKKVPAQLQVQSVLIAFVVGLLLGGIIIGVRYLRAVRKRPQEVS